MISNYHNEKRSSLQFPTYTRTHSPHSSISSTISSSSFSTISSSSDNEPPPPPPYNSLFLHPNVIKPLPALPASTSPSMSTSVTFSIPIVSHSKVPKVRFMEQKSLPPLPPSDIEERTSRRRGSVNGEYAWWNKRWSLSDEEYESIAREKETSGSCSSGKLTGDI